MRMYITPTPTGVFPITEKKRHHVSNLYDAPMPYMLRLTDDGIAIHQPVLATNASDAMTAIQQATPDLLLVGSTCENGEALALCRRGAPFLPGR